MICLDTNVVIDIFNARRPSVRERFQEQMLSGRAILLPVVALFELRAGAVKSNQRETVERKIERFLARGVAVAAFDPEDAATGAEIRGHLEIKGTPIGAYDLLIAAQALRRSATLVTANTREFNRVPGLLVADWTE